MSAAAPKRHAVEVSVDGVQIRLTGKVFLRSVAAVILGFLIHVAHVEIKVYQLQAETDACKKVLKDKGLLSEKGGNSQNAKND